MDDVSDKPNEFQPATETKRPFQFSIRTLIILTTVIAVILAIATQIPYPECVFLNGVFICVLIIGLVVWNKKALWKIVGMVLACIIILISFKLNSAIKATHDSAVRNYCYKHIRVIGLAFHNYHDDKGHFPPAFIADANGKPMHSWRVLILPYFGDDEFNRIYDLYKFDEPWDGPNNSKLHDLVPHFDGPLFHCPFDDGPETMTSYVAVVGPDTAWPGDKTVKLTDISDGRAKTLMTVEVVNSGIHWMEPRDLHVTQMNPRINPKTGQGISNNHIGVAAAFGDAAVRTLPNDLDPEMLRALLTISGGEDVSEFWDSY